MVKLSMQEMTEVLLIGSVSSHSGTWAQIPEALANMVLVHASMVAQYIGAVNHNRVLNPCALHCGPFRHLLASSSYMCFATLMSGAQHQHEGVSLFLPQMHL